MNRSVKAKVSTKGQVTIPLPVRRQVKIEVGDEVQFEVRGNTILLRPVVSLPKDEVFSEKEYRLLERLVRGQLSKKEFTSYGGLAAAKKHKARV